MATPTRPCPYCGAAVLMNATACGTCGRPMPPLASSSPPAPLGPTKTMFGYAAPSIPLPHRVPRVHGTTAPPGTAGIPQQPPVPEAPPQSFGSPAEQANPYVQPPPPVHAAPPPEHPPASPQIPSGSYGHESNIPPPAQPTTAVSRAPVLAIAGVGKSLPLERLRDPGLEHKVVLIAGIALLASIVIPYSIDPTIFPWKWGDTFGQIVWPIIAGCAYLLVTAAPPDLRKNVPSAVLQWIPFAVPVIGLLVGKQFGGLYTLGYATLVVGLLVHFAQPQDRIARIVIGVGAALLVPNYFDALHGMFQFDGVGALGVIHNLLWFAVWTGGILCILFVVPPHKLPPALQSIDRFTPMICSILIAWLPIQIAIGTLGMAGLHMTGLLMFVRGMIGIFSYFGVLIVTAPAAYDRIVAMFRAQPAQGG